MHIRTGGLGIGHLVALLFATKGSPRLQTLEPSEFQHTDTIQGRVVDTAARPILGALVTITADPSKARQAVRTNETGQFRLIFVDTAKSYTIVVRKIGYASATVQSIASPRGNSAIVPDIRLYTIVQELARVQVVRSRPSVRGRENETIQEGRTLLTNSTQGNGIDGLNDWLQDLSMLTLLSPSTEGPQFSFGGAAADQNNIMVGGNTYLGSTLPSLLPVRASLAIAQYDVSRGQFSGAQLQFTPYSLYAETQPQRLIAFTGTGPWLQAASPGAAGDGAPFGYYRLGLYWSHPLVYGKLASIFAADISRRATNLESLFGAGDSSLAQLGLFPDSVHKLGQLAQGAGIPLHVSAPSQQTTTAASGYWEVDYVPSLDFSTAFRLTGGLTQSQNLGATPFVSQASLTHGADEDFGVQGTASWTPAHGVSNTVQSYLAVRTDEIHPYLSIPRAAVQVLSPFDDSLSDGTLGATTVSLGGNLLSAVRAKRTLWETQHSTAWMSFSGRHRWKVATLLRFDGVSTIEASNVYGTFAFQSIEDFDAGRASSFTRTIHVGGQTNASAWSGALSIGDSWRPGGSVQVMYGVRGEASYLPIGQYDTSVTKHEFPLSTTLTEFRASPRVGLAWTPQAGQYGLFQVGTGEFRGTLSPDIVASVRNYRGLPDAFLNLQCIGAAAPTPDWRAYAENAVAIPSTCAGEADATTPTLQSQLPTVMAFSKHFQAPRVWRSSASWSKQWSRNRDEKSMGQASSPVSIDGSSSISLIHSLGEAQAGTLDLNLIRTPTFTLPAEGGRPMYVPLGAIDSATGLATLLSSRQDQALGQVLEQQSTLHYRSMQVIGSAYTGFSHRAQVLSLGFSYTWSDIRDQAYGGDVTGNPFLVGWGRSSLERRHQLTASIGFSTSRQIQAFLGITGRLSSGTPFTPLVDGDINGDGQYNDRVFLPAASVTTPLAQSLRQWLVTAPSRVRDCLVGQEGQLVARNSCTGPWSGDINVSALFRSGISKAWLNTLLGRRVISFSAQNVLAGLDQMLHPNSPRGWGGENLVDPTLLRLSGFDPSTRQFRYDINPNFGTTRAYRVLFRSPFVVKVNVTMPLGDSRYYRTHHLVDISQQADYDEAIHAVQHTLDLDPADSYTLLIRMEDTLLLTTDQINQLDQLETGLGPRREQVLENGAEQILQITRAPHHPNGARLDSLVQHKSQEIGLALGAIQQEWATLLAKMLAPEQVALLPFQLQAAVKNEGAGWDITD